MLLTWHRCHLGGGHASDCNLPRVWLSPCHQTGAPEGGALPVLSDSWCLKQGRTPTLHFWLHGGLGPCHLSQLGEGMLLE